MKILFICNQGRHRSKTAAEIFKSDSETDYAGLYADKPVTKEQMLWADIVVVMEEEQRAELAKRFPTLYLEKRILNFNITDIYNYGNENLQILLKQKMEELVQPVL